MRKAVENKLQKTGITFACRKVMQLWKDGEEAVSLLALQPSSRSAQHLQVIEQLIRRTIFFRELSLAKTIKYQEIIHCLAPYVEFTEFECGDIITVAGELRSHMHVLYHGEVYIFVPTNLHSYQSSIKLHNPKGNQTNPVNRHQNKKRSKPKPPLNKNSLYNVYSKDNFERHLTLIEAYDVIKDNKLASEMVNPHTYKLLLTDSLRVSAQPSRWYFQDIYDDCIAICKQHTICLSFRVQIYEAIKQYLQAAKRRELMKLLLDFFDMLLTYQQVQRYLDNPTRNHIKLKNKQEAVVESNCFYIVIDGQLGTFIELSRPTEINDQTNETKEHPNRNNIRVIHQRIGKSYRGQLIGCENIPNLKLQAIQTCKLFRLDPYVLGQHILKYPPLKTYLEQTITSKRNQITKIILQKQALLAQSLIEIPQVRRRSKAKKIKERRSMEDITLMEAIRQPMSRHQRRISESRLNFRGGIEQEPGSIQVLVNDHNSSSTKIIRKKRMSDLESDGNIYAKLGLLSEYQITELNTKILKSKPDAPVLSHEKLFPSIPRQKKTLSLHLPSVPMMSKRFQSLLNYYK